VPHRRLSKQRCEFYTELIEISVVPILTWVEIKNPEIAKQNGIVGYIEYNTTADTPRALVVARGKKRA